METLSAFGVLFIAMLGGFLGGMLSAHLFQLVQRAYDKRRWEELSSDASNKIFKLNESSYELKYE